VVGKNVDWIAIKNEYINTNISYRKLAEKWKISLGSIQRKSKKEDWYNLREKCRYKTNTKVIQKTQEKIIENEVNRMATLLAISDDVTEQLAVAAAQVRDDEGTVDTYKLRQIVQSLKDMREIIEPLETTKAKRESDPLSEALLRIGDELDAHKP